VVTSVSMLVHSHATANILNLAVEAAQPRQVVQGAVCESNFGNATRLCIGPPGLDITETDDCNGGVCTILAWLGTTTTSTVVSGLGPTDTVTLIVPTGSATPTGSSTAPVSSANPTSKSSTASVTTGSLVPTPRGSANGDLPAATSSSSSQAAPSSSSSQAAPSQTHPSGAASDRIRGGFLGLAVIGGAVAAAAMYA
jgi:hypothetical protein